MKKHPSLYFTLCQTKVYTKNVSLGLYQTRLNVSATKNLSHYLRLIGKTDRQSQP